MKIRREPGDTHPVGAMATVKKILPCAVDGEFAYFVEWDDCPGTLVFIRGRRVCEP